MLTGKTAENVQVKELNFQGYEVILVTSGAVGVGRQRLKYRKLINSRLPIQTSAHNSLFLTTCFDATTSFC
jgi:glutamate 5-kinase